MWILWTVLVLLALLLIYAWAIHPVMPKRPIPQVTDYIPIEIIISFSVIGGALLLIVGGIVAIVVIRRKRGCLKF